MLLHVSQWQFKLIISTHWAHLIGATYTWASHAAHTVINNMQPSKERSHGHMQLHAPITIWFWSYIYTAMERFPKLLARLFKFCGESFWHVCLRSWLILLHTFVLQYLSFVQAYFQAPVSQCATLETWERGLGRCYRSYITCVVLQ